MKIGYLLFIALFFYGKLVSAQTEIDPDTIPGSTGSVTFTYGGKQVTHTTVYAKDNMVWLQQDLGSLGVSQSPEDTSSVGDFFQWGRWDDGHQFRNSPTVSADTFLDINNPSGLDGGVDTFILNWWPKEIVEYGKGGDIPPRFWSEDTITKSNGKDPCFALGQDWRMPTIEEFKELALEENMHIMPNDTGFLSNSLYYSNLKIVNSSIISRLGRNGRFQTSYSSGGALYYTRSIENSSPVDYASSYKSPLYWGVRGVFLWLGSGDRHQIYYGRAADFSDAYRCRCIKGKPCSTVADVELLSDLQSKVCYGDTINLNAKYPVDPKISGITYQWQSSEEGLNWSNIDQGTGVNSMSMTTIPLSKYYRFVATCKHTGETSISDIITVNIVKEPEVPTLSIDISPGNMFCEKAEEVTLTAINDSFGELISGPNWYVNNSLVAKDSFTYSYMPSHNDSVYVYIEKEYMCVGYHTLSSEINVFKVLPNMHKPVISVNDKELTSSSANGNQWYRNDQLIDGANQQKYMVVSEGSYHVEVEVQDSCKGVSEKVYVNPNSINKVATHSRWIVYPNPFNEFIQVDLPSEYSVNYPIQLNIYDYMGRKVMSQAIHQEEQLINTQHLPSGIYVFVLTGEAIGHISMKVIKE